MKKNLGILSLALVAGLSLVSCNGKQTASKEMGSVIKTKQDVYAYSMFSSSTLLDNLSAPAIAGVAANNNADKQVEVDKVDEYVKMFDGLLSKKGINQTTEKNTNADFAEYETKMTVIQSGKTYHAYLNETAKHEEDKDKEESDEVEVSTLLSGLMFEMGADGNAVASYIIEGSKEVETEKEEGETEQELSIEFTSSLAEKNAEGKYDKVSGAKTVTVKQEFETETKEDGTVEKEQSFKYTVKDADGKKIPEECSKVKIEEENGETEIKLTVGAEQGKKMYKFNKEADTLKIQVVESGQPTQHITVTFKNDANGNPIHEYAFEDGTKLEEKEED